MRHTFNIPSLRFGLLLGTTYALLLITIGFRIYEDAAIPPWALVEHCPSCFQKDAFLHKVPLERRQVLPLYRGLVDRWQAVFFVHAIFSLVLLAGLWRVAFRITGSESAAWVGLWIVLPGLYHHHWGSNEVYYGYIHPSLLAKAIGAWVWALLLDRRPLAAGVVALLTTALHPSVGVLTWLFSLPILLTFHWRERLRYAPFSLLIIGYALYLSARNTPTDPAIRALWERVFIDFRMSMHFDPGAFRRSSHVLFGGLLLGGLYAAYRLKLPVFWSFLAFAVGIGAYVINFYTVRWQPLLYLQVPRATVWLKPLGVFTIMALVSRRWHLPDLSLRMAAVLAALLGWSAFRLSREQPGVEYLQIFRWREAEPYRLGTWIHQNLPDTVLIAVPPTAAGEKVQFFARRSAFIWLGELFHTDQPEIYARRIQRLYGVNPLEGRAAWQQLLQKGEYHFAELCEKYPDSLRAWGITHVIVPSQQCLPYPCLWRGEQFTLYTLHATESSATLYRYP